MSEEIIRIKSGNEEFTLNVTKESYEVWKDSASEEVVMARAGNRLPAPTSRHHIFSVYTAASRGDCGIYLFDIFLSLFPTDYKRIQCFYDRRTWNSSGALFLRFRLWASAAVQEPCAAPLVLKNV